MATAVNGNYAWTYYDDHTFVWKSGQSTYKLKWEIVDGILYHVGYTANERDPVGGWVSATIMPQIEANLAIKRMLEGE